MRNDAMMPKSKGFILQDFLQRKQQLANSALGSVNKRRRGRATRGNVQAGNRA